MSVARRTRCTELSLSRGNDRFGALAPTLKMYGGAVVSFHLQSDCTTRRRLAAKISNSSSTGISDRWTAEQSGGRLACAGVYGRSSVMRC